MKIEIDDGEPQVQFRKSEKTALREARRLCLELHTWLQDENAEAASNFLEQVAKKYLPDGTDEREVAK